MVVLQDTRRLREHHHRSQTEFDLINNTQSVRKKTFTFPSKNNSKNSDSESTKVLKGVKSKNSRTVHFVIPPSFF